VHLQIYDIAMRDLFMQVTAEIFPPQQPLFAEMSPVEFDSHASLQIYVNSFSVKSPFGQEYLLQLEKRIQAGQGPLKIPLGKRLRSWGMESQEYSKVLQNPTGKSSPEF